MRSIQFLRAGVLCVLFGLTRTLAQDTTPPTAPSNLSVSSVTRTEASLAWNAATDNVGVTSYQVFRDGVLAWSGSGTMVVIGALAPNTLYQFTVRAKDAAGNYSALSAPKPTRTWQFLIGKSGYIDSWSTGEDEDGNSTGTDYSTNWHGFDAPADGWAQFGVDHDVEYPGVAVVDAGHHDFAVSGPESGSYYVTVEFKLRGKPVANIAASTVAGRSPLTVNFDATASTDANGVLTSYNWDFDNNGSIDSTSVSASRVYTNTGASVQNYTVKLTVVDYEGFVGPATKTIAVYPAGSFGMTVQGGASNLPYQMPNSPVTLTAAAPAAGQQFSHWTIVTGAGTFSNASSVTTTFTMASADTVVKANYVADTTAPAAPTNLAVSEVELSQVTLTWSAATDNVGVIGYEVFQDGTPVWSNAGTWATIGGLAQNTLYQFTVRAKDAAGNYSAHSAVSPVRTWQAFTTRSGYINSWSSGDDEDGNSTGTDYSTDTHYFTAPALGWARFRYAGNPVDVPPVRTVEPGSNSFQVRGPEGGSYTVYVDFKLRGAPVANIAASASAVRSPFTVNFDAAGSTDVNGVLTSYHWDFDNNGSIESTSVTASRLYTNTGTSVQNYTVKLTVVDYEGFPAFATKTIAVYPSGSFGMTVQGGTSNLPYQMPNSTVTLTAAAPVAGQQFSHWAIVSGAGTFGNTSAVTTTFTMASADTVVKANYVADTTAPTIPANLAATVGLTDVSLTWNAATDNVGVVAYEVFRNGVSAGTWPSTSITIGSLAQNTAYQFTVRAKDAAGNYSAHSSPIGIRTWQYLTTVSGYIDSWSTGEDEDGNSTGTDYGTDTQGYNVPSSGRVRFRQNENTVEMPGETDVNAGYNYASFSGPEGGYYRVDIDFKLRSAPVAIIAATPTVGRAPLAVSFNGSSSADPGGPITNYAWDFDGNGTTDASGASTSTTYANSTAAPINYSPKLTVTGSESVTATATATVTVYPAISYSLTVQSGAASVPYLVAGGSATVTANPPPADYRFNNWSIVSGSGSFVSATSASTSFAIGSGDTVVRANYVSLYAPQITSPTAASGIPGVAFSYAIISSGSPTSYSVNGSLPQGLSLNTTTGVISGTPGSVGVASVTVTAVNAMGSATQPLTISILYPPVIVEQPSNLTVDRGGSATLVVSVTGTEPLTYQWRKSGVAVPDGTRAALTLRDTLQSDAGSYSVVVSNASGTVTSASATLTVNGPPIITAQPIDRVVDRGLATTFTVSAAGTPGSFTYQWRKGQTNLTNGGNISGATSATLTVSNAQLSDIGSYSVVVSNAYGSTSSSPAALSLTPVSSFEWVDLTPAPVVAANYTDGFSGRMRFRAKIKNTGTTTWTGQQSFIAKGLKKVREDWQPNPYELDYFNGYEVWLAFVGFPYGAAPGQTIELDISLTNIPNPGAGEFGLKKYGVRLVPTGFAAGSPSAERYFQSVDLGYMGQGWPRITSPIVMNTVKGQAATYQTTAYCSNGPVNDFVFAWVSEPTVTNFSFNSATGAVSFTPHSAGTTYRFNIYGRLANTVYYTPVHAVDLVVANAGSGSPPVISSNLALPSGSVWYPYFPVQMTATNSPTNWSYVSGTVPTNMFFSSSGVISSNNMVIRDPPGDYAFQIKAENAAGIDIKTVTVTIAPGPSPATITSQPQGLTAAVNSSVTLTVGATGNPTPVYRWEKDGVAISGATGSTLPLLRVQSEVAGRYRVHVSNPYDWNYSNEVTVAVAGQVTNGLTAQYFDNVNFSGAVYARTDDTVDFIWDMAAPAPVIGADTFSVRWTGQIEAPVAGTYTFTTESDDGVRLSIGGVQRIDGWTASGGIPQSRTAVVTDLQAGQRYDIVMEYFDDKFGARARLFWEYPGQTKQIVPKSRLFPVAPVVAPTITMQPIPRSVAEGAVVSFSVTATGTAPLNYQWRKDNQPLSNGGIVSGAMTNQLTLTGVGTINAGRYDVLVSNTAGQVESTGVNLTVSSSPPSAPTITTQPTSQQVSPGANPSFTVGVSGTAPFSYQWRRFGVDITGATSATLSLPDVQVISAGRYDVVVTNGLGSVTSAGASLVVVTNLPSADDDGDGVDNAIETSLGLNPHDLSDTNVYRYQYDRLGRLRAGPGGQYTIDEEGNIKEVRP